MKVVILNDEGHETLTIENQQQLDEIKQKYHDKWFFIGESGQKTTLNEVTLDGIREIQVIEPLIGG